jgi:hypothetical protein
MSTRLGWLRDERVRLVLLLALLASLVVYLVASSTGALGLASGPSGDTVILGNCPVAGAPSAATLPRGRLLGLRRDIRRVVSFEPGLRPYELGPIGSIAAWSDSEPGTSSSLPAGTSDQAGYEMRWWAFQNRDDVVVDAWVFADTNRAHDFFTRASSTKCRPASSAAAASFPLGGRDLQWRNPENAAQEDLYLLRGRRVYRVSVVKAWVGGSTSAADRKAAFSLVNELACALPGAGCDVYESPSTAAAA